MKAEYPDERDNNPHRSISQSLPPPNMFSKFNQPPPSPLHHPHPQYHPHLQHHHHPDLNPNPNPPFHYSKDSQTSEEADSAAAASPAPPAKKPKPLTRSDDGGGETIEVVRRPRGRPPGSKNKPKLPTVITREPDAPSMAPYILEIPAGADIVESLVRITRRRGIGLCVLSGSGAVANVSLRQPSGASGGGTVTFHGRFELASLSAVVLPGGNILGGSHQQQLPLLSLPFGDNTVDGGAFTVTLSAPQGHIVGGKVVGPLLAAGTVYVVAASFNNPTFHKLPVSDDDNSGLGGGGEEDGGHQQVSSPAVSGGGEGSGDMGGAGSGGVMYNCHVGGPDVVWAPTARPPHQPPPY